MNIQLSDHFTYPKLLRFVFPSITMMVFTSIYGAVDGFFVSNYVGKTPFAAINLIYPVLSIFGAMGLMAGTGGSAIVARTLGEGRPEQANRYFSMITEAVIVGGVLLMLLGLWLLTPLARLLGAQGKMQQDAVLYGSILLMALVPCVLQNLFESFLITAERPKLGLVTTAAAGITNMALDFLFIVVFRWGLAGAAAATALSQAVGGFIPLAYFLSGRNHLLRLHRARVDWRVLWDTCVNGSSEVLTNIAIPLMQILFNFFLLEMAGENGVAAYGAIMYINFLFMAVFFGYSIGCSPVISYHYGAGNVAELQGLFRKSIFLNVFTGLAMSLASLLFSRYIVGAFVGYDEALFDLTRRGLLFYASRYAITSLVVFSSGFFTALGNGVISSTISFLRAVVFQFSMMMILPRLLGTDGIWLAVVVGDLLSAVVAAGFLAANRRKDRYW